MATQSIASPQDDTRALDALTARLAVVKWESDGYSAAETPSDHVQPVSPICKVRCLPLPFCVHNSVATQLNVLRA